MEKIQQLQMLKTPNATMLGLPCVRYGWINNTKAKPTTIIINSSDSFSIPIAKNRSFVHKVEKFELYCGEEEGQ